MKQFFLNQPVSLCLHCTLDGARVKNATSAVVNYKSPSDATGTLAATISQSTGIVSCLVAENELDELGVWQFQPVVTLGDGLVIPGSVVSMTVKATI